MIGSFTRLIPHDQAAEDVFNRRNRAILDGELDGDNDLPASHETMREALDKAAKAERLA